MKQSYKLVLLSLSFCVLFQNFANSQFATLELIEPSDIGSDLLVPGTVYTITLKYETPWTAGPDAIDPASIITDVTPEGGATILSGPIIGDDGCTLTTTFTPLIDDVDIFICCDDRDPLTQLSKAIYRTGAIAVPVQFSSIYGSQHNKEVKIEWETDIEVGNEKFIIERAYADSGFFPIGEIDGAGNSLSKLSYQFMDLNPKSGVNAYRIKQQDFNGVGDYSETISVVYFSDKDIQLTPNPASKSIDNPMLYIHSDHPNTVAVGIYNVVGKLISAQTHIVNEGQNRFALQSQNLHEGLYLVKIDIGDYTQTQKLFLDK